MAKIPKRKTERAPPVDKLLKPAIVVGLALLAYQFMKGLDSEIPRVDTTDQLALREVFFGESGTGKSYAVLCHTDTDDKPLPISSVFQEAHNDGSSPAEFRLLDCEATLESGKTVAERFKLDLKKRPTIFVSGTVGPPKQVPSKHLKTGSMLTKLLRNMLEPRAAKIETTQDLRTKCLDKDYCGLLLKGSKQVQPYVKDAMANLLAQHPEKKVAFASVDTSVLFVRNLEEYLPEYATGQHRFAVFQKQSTGEDRLKTSVAPLPQNGVTFSNMNNLVNSVVSGKQDMTKLTSLPVLKTRTKKLEEEERAKRQRRAAQQQRANQKTTTTTDESFFSQFKENDGSAEGRRAERERRRAEHRQQHNVREKTPEEIQEMERKRRIRMEEEAAKWNIAPEDAPPEGDTVVDEDIIEEGDGEDGEDEQDEDEEVMDLD